MATAGMIELASASLLSPLLAFTPKPPPAPRISHSAVAAAAAAAAAAGAFASSSRQPTPPVPLPLAPTQAERRAGDRLASDRNACLPPSDASLILLGAPLRLQPSCFPSYLCDSATPTQRVLSVISTASIGALDKLNPRMVVPRPSPEQIPLKATPSAQTKPHTQGHTAQEGDMEEERKHEEEEDEDENEDEDEGEGEDEDEDEETAPQALPYPYATAPPVPPHSVYRIAVPLHFVDPIPGLLQFGEDVQQTSPMQQLTAAIRAENFWRTAVRGYRSMELLDDSADEHYQRHILQVGQMALDPHFPLGLFGLFNNGLTHLLLALARINTQPTRKKAGTKRAKLQEEQRRLEEEMQLDSEDEQKESGPSSAAAALSSASLASSSKIADCVLDFLALVSLQYWTLVHRRWLELDPAQAQASDPVHPPYLFFFFPNSDFEPKDTGNSAVHQAASTQPKQKGRKRKQTQEGAASFTQTAGAAPESLQEAAQLHFMPFLQWVIQQVIARMAQLERSNEPGQHEIRDACQKLRSVLESRVEQRSTWLYKTNHSQWFTTSRFTRHSLEEHQQVMNKLFNRDSRLMIDSTIPIKFFPRNKKDTGVQWKNTKIKIPHDPRARFINPYFWSHHTFTPVQALISTESNLLYIDAAEAKSDRMVSSGLHDAALAKGHQACLLRRLAFLASTSNLATIQQAFAYMGSDGVSLRFAFRAPAQKVYILTAHQFCSQFVGSSDPMRMEFEKIQSFLLDPSPGFVLPPVVNAVALRCSLFWDHDDQPHAYLPLLSREFASRPLYDEQDILCYTKQQFMRLYHQGKQRPYADSLHLAAHLPRDIARSGSHTSHMQSDLMEKFHFVKRLQLRGATPALSRRFALSEVERQELTSILHSTFDHTIDPLALWGLFTKICRSEQQVVYSFVNRMLYTPRIKEEPGLASSNAAPKSNMESATEQQLAQLFFELQRLREIQLVRHFRIFSLSPRARSLFAQDSLLQSPWDFCQRPQVSPSRLADSMVAALRDDLQFLKLQIVNTDGTVVDIDSPPAQTEAAAASSDPQPSPSEVWPFMEQALKRLYSEFLAGAEATTRPNFRLFRNLRIICTANLLLSDKSKARPSNAELELGHSFRHFFGLQGSEQQVQFADATLEPLFLFFLWHLDRTVLTPFRNCFSLFYPDSSLISLPQPGMGSVIWPHTLLPASQTPRLTALRTQLLCLFSAKTLLAELHTCDQQKIMVDDNTEATLLAMQAILGTYNDTEQLPQEAMDMLHLAPQLTASVLTNKQRSQQSLSISGTVLSRFIHTAVTQMRTSIVLRSCIPDDLLSDWVKQLCVLRVADVQETIIQIAQQAFKYIFGPQGSPESRLAAKAALSKGPSANQDPLRATIIEHCKHFVR